MTTSDTQGTMTKFDVSWGDQPSTSQCLSAAPYADPDQTKICGIIVTYQPDSEFVSRARRLLEQLPNLVVVDNGSSPQSLAYVSELADGSNVHLILNTENRGIATALNQGVNWAIAQGFGWVLTLDQDSLVHQDMVDSLCAVYRVFPDQSKLAVIGSNYIDSSIDRPFFNANENVDCCWQEVKTAITSGSLITVSGYRLIGPFKEELFIDCVDFEYCLRARSMGFHVVITRKPLMEHGIGNMTVHQLPWKTTTTSNHSAARRYYMTRNQIILTREYFAREPVWTARMLYRHLKATLLMCFFEKDVWRKLKLTFIGMIDGISANFHRQFR